MTFYVFDLDGTLADCSHRVHHVRDGKCDWDQFFMECDRDTPIWPNIELLRNLRRQGHQVEIWSGRSEVCRELTEEWLGEFLNWDEGDTTPLLKMRPTGDHQPDVTLKRSWLYESDMKPDIIFDDRQCVVDMWREEGIICHQVAKGDFDDIGTRLELTPPLDPQEPMLIVLIGPSGAGKSTLAENMLKHRPGFHRYISSDLTRIALCGDKADQSRNKEVFRACHESTRTLIRNGIPVIFDATNLKNRDRKKVVDLCPPEYKVTYIVVDRPMEDKVRDGGWRNEVEVKGKPLMEYHEQVFNSNIKDILNGDGYGNVEVVDARQV